jgi:hypothetical protein
MKTKRWREWGPARDLGKQDDVHSCVFSGLIFFGGVVFASYISSHIELKKLAT